MNCENCGMPEGAYSSPGYRLTLQFMPQVGQQWKRQQRRTVWVCGSACAVQTMAIAAMGTSTHKWPMTFKEFVSQMQATGKLDFLTGHKRHKLPSETRINSEVEEIEFSNLMLSPMAGVCDAQKGGRPAIDNPGSSARRMRRLRAKKSPVS